jgi:hypothetical protein
MSVEKILKQHFKAIGQKKLSTVNSMKITGTNAIMGMEVPFSMQTKRPGLIRVEADIQGAKMIQTYNGKEGYMVAPWTGSTEPQLMEEGQLDDLKGNSDIDGKLYNYKEKGSKIEYIGKEDINGVATYKLKLVEKPAAEGQTGKTSHFFIDSKTYNVVKTLTTSNMQGVDTEVETIFSDFRTVEGVVMSFKMEMNANGSNFSTLVFEEVKFNVEMDNSIFEKPAN